MTCTTRRRWLQRLEGGASEVRGAAPAEAEEMRAVVPGCEQVRVIRARWLGARATKVTWQGRREVRHLGGIV